MLLKERKHFRNARNRYGSGIFDGIVEGIAKAAASTTAKKISEKAVEGIAHGIKQGAEQGSKELIKKAVNKITKATKKPVISITDVNKGANKVDNETAEMRTQKLLSLLRSGSGIKTIH